MENNTYGIFANGTGSTGAISVQIRDSAAASNGFGGVSAYLGAGNATTSIMLDRSSSLLNGADGILAQGSAAFIILGSSTVTSNVTGLHSSNGGSIFSYQNNRLTGQRHGWLAPAAVLTVSNNAAVHRAMRPGS